MIAPLLEKLQRHDALTTDEAANAMAAIMRGEVTPAQIAGLLMALRSKGERPEELVGLARAIARQLERPGDTRVVRARALDFAAPVVARQLLALLHADAAQ